ncbi:serine/threonine-protein kinase [bacterium]|nr:serine/threonine-protein kinase [bacterium]
MIGKTILQYEILEQLGEGGMGVVYKAQDTKLDRFVALKFLPANVSSTDSDRQRFMQEAKSAATLSHPNICTIYDVQEFEGQLFIAMEYIEGETLRDRKNNISFKQSIDIGIQVAEALAAAHERGIIHRDIKPENVMLRKDGRAQIMDFGLAKQQGASRLTKQGSTVGTIGYMSPEQVQGFNVDHRTDIFSFGVLLYELVSGQSPFKGLHETAIIYEIVNVDAEPVSIIKPDLPADLDAILLECLAKDPDERYQSAKETVKDLRKLKRESSKQTASRVLAVRQSQINSGVRPQTAVFETVQEKKPFAFNIWMMVSALSVLSLLILLTTYFLFVKTEPELMRLSFESPHGEFFNATNGGHIEISPNGKMIAIVATDSSGKNHLWVRPINSPIPVLLQGTDNAYYPFWSHDSKMIAYFADGKLKKIDANGGPSFSLCDAASGRGGTWNKEGVIVFSPTATGPLHQVSSAGGTSKELTVLDSTEFEVSHRWPFFLPGGDHFLYSVQTNKASLDQDADLIRVGSLHDSKNKIIIRTSSNAVYNQGWVLYYKQKSLLAQRFNEASIELEGEPIPILENLLYERARNKGAFSLSHNNRLVFLATSVSDDELAVYGSNGVLQHKIKLKIPVYRSAFSKDGNLIAIDALQEGAVNEDIWIHDIRRNSDTRLTFDKASEIVPEWSPDGSKVYFSSNRTGVFCIYEKNSNGTGDERLVYGSKLASYVTDISQDGKRLLLSVNTQGAQKWDLGMYDLEEKKFIALLFSQFNEWIGRFSPDGKWFAYQSDETGKYEIYIRPTDGSPSKWQVSTNGGGGAIWLDNGKEVVFNVNNQEVFIVPVSSSGDQIVVGQARSLFKSETGLQTSIRDVSGDGKKILLKRTLNAQALRSASLIFNWQNLVEKK